MSSTDAPLFLSAILYPIFAFPSWILCIPPLFWHFRQGNIAAGSLFLWIIMVNFFNSINPLIWPRDNIDEWWNGAIWCDINARIQIGATVGTTASAAMIVRKLAKVMDTRNITVTSSRDSKMKEKILDIVWCWLYPIVLISVYYIVQPIRYFIFGIMGCWSAYDSSWPSILLGYMWAPITILVATGYAVLLSYRLYRYRREFVRLVAARNTTKSRFIRLFIICIVIIAAYVPYTIWLLVVICRTLTDKYSWHRVHNPASFHSIIKQPVHGVVSVDKWGQVASGYVLFFVLGTGADAYNTYKKTLTAMGLGRVFPSLYILRKSGASTPNSFLNAKSWTESLSSKAKGMFWSRSSLVAEDTLIGSRNNSLAMVDTGARCEHQGNRKSAWLGRLWGRRNQQQTVLPVFVDQRIRSIAEMTVDDDAHKEKVSPRAEGSQGAENGGVRVFHEVRLEMDEQATESKAHEGWAASVKGGADAV